MPEGPEYRYLAELLKQHILNHNLTKIEALSKTKINLPEELRIKNIFTKGKLIVLVSNDYYVHITLGISGWITFEEPKYTKYILEFNNNKIFIDDSRKFSKIGVYNKNQHDKIIDGLGIDFMTSNFTIDVFREKITNSRKNICAFLLDQHIFSGIGNYNKNESLYIAKISPYRNSSEIDDNEIAKLYKAIRYVGFSTFIEMMNGSKLKIPLDIESQINFKIQVPYKYRVYEKETDLKGNKVTFATVAGRNTYFVKSLQK